jgi:hypothetical protein
MLERGGNARSTKNIRRGNFLTEDDITNFAGRQRGDIDAVSLSEILFKLSKDSVFNSNNCRVDQSTYRQNEILQRELDFDPLVVRQRRPYEMPLRYSRFVRPKDNFGLFIIHVQPTEKKDEPRECRIGAD